jgi:hypothetical protein
MDFLYLPWVLQFTYLILLDWTTLFQNLLFQFYDELRFRFLTQYIYSKGLLIPPNPCAGGLHLANLPDYLFIIFAPTLRISRKSPPSTWHEAQLTWERNIKSAEQAYHTLVHWSLLDMDPEVKEKVPWNVSKVTSRFASGPRAVEISLVIRFLVEFVFYLSFIYIEYGTQLKRKIKSV